ncbi:hypothetical protein G6F57_020936 [Rhizopus arrhizus]|nr:hypothetical protein G6F57_020936 [Rhizopus arrhizus]
MGVATLAKMNIFALAVVGARKARGFSKDTLRGDTVEGVSSPAVERVPALLQQRLSEYFNAYPDAVPSAPVTWLADPLRAQAPHHDRGAAGLGRIGHDR